MRHKENLVWDVQYGADMAVFNQTVDITGIINLPGFKMTALCIQVEKKNHIRLHFDVIALPVDKGKSDK